MPTAPSRKRRLAFEQPNGPLASQRAAVGIFVDGYIAACGEGSKSVAREMFSFMSQCAHGISASLFQVVESKDYYVSAANRFAAPSPDSSNSDSWHPTAFFDRAVQGEWLAPSAFAANSDADSVVSEDVDEERRKNKVADFLRAVARVLWRLLLIVFLWIPVIGVRFFRTSPSSEEVKRGGDTHSQKVQKLGLRREISTDRINDHPHLYAEGLVESLQLGTLSFIDKVAKWVRWTWYKILFLQPISRSTTQQRPAPYDDTTKPRPKREQNDAAKNSHSSKHQSSSLSGGGLVDSTRIIGEVVRRAGYPFETRSVLTDDGHILLLERLPRIGSKKVLFLMHGILDSSHAWVGNGVASGLAFRAYDRGFDVFLGNFRGTRGKLHSDPNVSARQYWDFSLDDHGTKDIPSLIDAICLTKRGEYIARADAKDLDENAVLPPDTTIAAVAHSMGCAATMIYLITRRIQNIPHHLSRVVLMSPAGYHSSIPRICRWLGPILNATVARISPAFYVPGETTRAWLSRFMSEVGRTPALGNLYALAMSWLVGGEAARDHPIVSAPGLTQNAITSGTSSLVFRQFWNNYKKGKFMAFDWGTTGNLARYGSAVPLDYMSHFNLLQIPIHFMAGAKDTLIPPVDIKHQYEQLRFVKPELASYKEFPGLGHIDFTYGLDDALTADVFRHAS